MRELEVRLSAYTSHLRSNSLNAAMLLFLILFSIPRVAASSLPSGIPVIDIGSLISHPDAPSPSSKDDGDGTSLASSRGDAIRRIGDACRDVGFFAITNHGISPSVIDDAWDAARKFFDLPAEKKEAVRDMGGEYPYGYERSERLEVGKKAGGEREGPSGEGGPEKEEEECAAEGASECLPTPPPPPPPVDLKETFSLGPPDASESGMPPRRFPPEPSELAPALESYYSAMEGLARVLLRAFAAALELDEDWFDGKMDRHASALRCVNYPALEEAAEGQIRAGAHTDYGALTILRSGGPGLQVARDKAAFDNIAAKEDNDVEPHWVDAPDLPDAFIVNLGDLMQRWTNDEWRSTLHRVVTVPAGNVSNAPAGVGAAERRQSMAYFVNVNNDAVIIPLDTCVGDDRPARYRGVVAGDYLMRKHLASMGVPFLEE